MSQCMLGTLITTTTPKFIFKERLRLSFSCVLILAPSPKLSV
jgi:hypothetical protein